jgi:hypothetical protein
MKLKKSILAGPLALAMFATACSASWVSQAIAITNALLPVAVNVIQLVTAMQSSGGSSSSDVALAQKWAATVSVDLTLVQTLLNQYSAAAAADKPGFLNRLNDALQVVSNDLGTLLPALHISNPQTQVKVTAMVGLVAAEIGAIEALVSAAQGKTSLPRNAPKVMDAKNFKAAYKTLVKAPTGYAPLDQATTALVLP